MEFASFAKADGELDPGALEVELQWNQGETFLIQVNPKLVDLTPMGEQAPDPQGVVVEVGPRMACLLYTSPSPRD